MKATVDRIEENKVIVECENGELVTFERSMLKNVREGDRIIISEDNIAVTERINTKSIFEKLRNKKN